MVSIPMILKYIEFPDDHKKRLTYEVLSDTDLLELAKSKTYALTCAVSSNEDLIAFFCRDRKIRVFNIRNGKMIANIDDSLSLYIEYQATKATGAVVKSDMLYLEKLDFERRMAVERDIEKQWDINTKQTSESFSVMPSVGFDESGTFFYFGTPVGIKVYNIQSKQYSRVIGKVESTERFL